MPKVTAPTLSPRTHYMRKALGRVLENIPSGEKFYLTIDADGVTLHYARRDESVG